MWQGCAEEGGVWQASAEVGGGVAREVPRKVGVWLRNVEVWQVTAEECGGVARNTEKE